jgi:hypothetical protein
VVHQLHDLKEQDSTGIVESQMVARIGEGLARKASTAHVKRGDGCRVDSIQVTQRLNPVIGSVRLASGGVNVACHHTLHALGSKRVVKASNSSAEVNKLQRWHWDCCGVEKDIPFSMPAKNGNCRELN